MEYDIFICHASEDKKDFVKPLADALRKNNLKVWYDEFELKLGDKLREKIDYGLANSSYGVVVLSKAFFAKDWPKSELDGLVARQNSEGRKVILPIWHKVTRIEVQQFSPMLAGLVSAKSEDGLEIVVESIVRVFMPLSETPSQAPVTPPSKSWRPAENLQIYDFKVGIDYYHGSEPSKKAFDFWEEQGVSLVSVETQLSQEVLSMIDVFFLCVSHSQNDATTQESHILRNWIANGGIFIVNPLTWVAESYDKKDPKSYAPNILVQYAGIFFDSSYLHNDSFQSDMSLKKGQIGFTRNTMRQHPITEGVERLVFKGTPGITQVSNKDAIIIWGEREKPAKTECLPYLVVVPMGKGLIIGFQHNGLLNDGFFTDNDPLAQFDNAKLWYNILAFIWHHKRTNPKTVTLPPPSVQPTRSIWKFFVKITKIPITSVMSGLKNHPIVRFIAYAFAGITIFGTLITNIEKVMSFFRWLFR
jgi:hypothetical protein